MIDYYIASLVNMLDEDIATRAVELSEGRFTLALNFALSGSFSWSIGWYRFLSQRIQLTESVIDGL